MRTETAPTVRLADYAPPDFLADEIELSFRLAPTGARVRARVRFRRNPEGNPAADLRLDGRALRLVSAAIDGAAVPQNALTVDAEGLTVAAAHVPDGLRLGGGDRDRPRGQHRARGALHVARHVLHPVRGAGVPQDHLLAGPARRDGAVPGADRGGGAGACCRTATSWRRGRAGPSGRTRSRSRPTCSRWWRATSSRSRTGSSPCPGARCCCRSGCGRATRTAAATRWTR